MNRWFQRSLVVTAVSAATVAAMLPPAYALTTTTLEAESGWLSSGTCGSGSGSSTDGTRGVMVMVGDGCKLNLDADTSWRRPRGLRFRTVNGCARFHLTGGFVSTSDANCSSATTYYYEHFGAMTGDGGADLTLELDATSGTPTVYVDHVELRAIEAESGTIVNSLCGDAEVMAVQGSGTNATVLYTASGCSQTFNVQSGVTPSGAVASLPGGTGTTCGYFEFTGAFIGTTATHCGSTAAWKEATLLSGLGSTYTVTWRTSVGTPSTQNASLNYLSFS